MLLLAGVYRVDAEVILSPKEGNRLIGEFIRSEDTNTVELEIYRGFTRKVPVAAIVKREEIDRSQRAEREEFSARLQALKPGDVAGRLELVQWGRTKGLGVQAAGLLMELKGRFADDPGFKRAVAVRPFAQSLTEQARTNLCEKVVAFFAAEDRQAAILASLEGSDVIPAGSADEWARVCLAEARKGGKVKEGDSKFSEGGLESDVHIERWRRPAEKGPAPEGDEGPWPVVVALHGGGENDGNWQSGGPMYRTLFQRHLEKMIFVAPTVMRKSYAEWGGNPDEERQVKAILRAVRRTWNVDTDRVYLCGYSMGGYGTWHIGGHEADQFAGLISGAGGILLGSARGEAWGLGIIGNLMHTPIAFIHGGKDEPAPPWSDETCDRLLTALAAANPGSYRHWFKLYPGSGHGLPQEGSAAAVEWATQFRREPYPAKVCWEPKRDFNRQFYWLRVERPQVFMRLEAAISSNAVRVTTQNINGGFSVLLNRRLADLDKPVTVEVDGRRVYEGLVPETLSTILTTVADRIDERQWFSARIDF